MEKKLLCECGRAHTHRGELQPVCWCGSTKLEEVTGRAIYRVYRAEFSFEDSSFEFSCSNVREVSLRRDIETGHLLIKPNSLKLLVETFDRNEARALATEL